MSNFERMHPRTGASQRSFFDKRYLHALGAALNRRGNRVPATEYNEIVVPSLHRSEILGGL
jgi:hypothetical protein